MSAGIVLKVSFFLGVVAWRGECERLQQSTVSQGHSWPGYAALHHRQALHLLPAYLGATAGEVQPVPSGCDNT